MCGRFALGFSHTQIQQLEDYPDLQSQVSNWVERDQFVPRYNIAPRTYSPVIHRSLGSNTGSSESARPLVLRTMKWGVVPHWSKTEDNNLSTINARAENLTEAGSSGMWGSIKGKKRCAVLAQGYYEWLKKGKERVPYFTRHRDGKLALFAGLYDIAHVEGRSEPLWTFTIVTTSAPKAFQWLHDRQPVILSESADINLWLDTSTPGWSNALNLLLGSYKDASERLECYAVPKEVGRVGTESPTFVEPVSKRKDGIEAMFAKQGQRATSSSPAKRKRSTSPGEKPTGTSDYQSENPETHTVTNEVAASPLGSQSEGPKEAKSPKVDVKHATPLNTG
ncbi:hypothetical protein K488DRAFT_90516 [Vararia minispora EC-137]|uniref:Uncharacterized protein n=1 Tax=Vararia minispora EC-137 TaxID=1314806 RepID=A0ACB8Q7F6_9AGAM|nr:hypothetical protein K488DRAFT_90516 [Vararia minispora EC-137]